MQITQYEKIITQYKIYKDEIIGDNGLYKKLENAKEQLKDLQRKYDILSVLKKANIKQDPNALYQLGKPVGRLIGAIIDLSHSQVLYQSMRYQGDYNPNSPSEFQDVKIQCMKNIGAAPPGMGNSFSGMVTGGSCLILGSVQ